MTSSSLPLIAKRRRSSCIGTYGRLLMKRRSCGAVQGEPLRIGTSRPFGHWSGRLARSGRTAVRCGIAVLGRVRPRGAVDRTRAGGRTVCAGRSAVDRGRSRAHRGGRVHRGWRDVGAAAASATDAPRLWTVTSTHRCAGRAPGPAQARSGSGLRWARRWPAPMASPAGPSRALGGDGRWRDRPGPSSVAWLGRGPAGGAGRGAPCWPRSW